MNTFLNLLILTLGILAIQTAINLAMYKPNTYRGLIWILKITGITLLILSGKILK